FFFQAEDGIRDPLVTGVQTCALPILAAYLFAVHIADTLTSPDLITQEAVDPQRLVYYRTYQAQPQRWLKVVVEQGEVVTAYRVKIGRASCRDSGRVRGEAGGE